MERREPEYSEQTPDDQFQKCHIPKHENSSPNWDSNLYSSIGGMPLLASSGRANHYITHFPYIYHYTKFEKNQLLYIQTKAHTKRNFYEITWLWLNQLNSFIYHVE